MFVSPLLMTMGCGLDLPRRRPEGKLREGFGGHLGESTVGCPATDDFCDQVSSKTCYRNGIGKDPSLLFPGAFGASVSKV